MKNHIRLISIFCIILIFVWFKDGTMFLSAEEGTPVINNTSTFFKYQFLWSEMGTGVASLNNLSRLSLYFVMSIFSNIGLSPLIQQALYFLFILLTASISMYFLVDKIFELKKDKRVALYSAILYLFNPFTLSQIWARGLYTFIGLYALLPLTIFLLYKCFTTKKYLQLVLTVAASLVFSDIFVHPTTLMTYWIVVGLVYFYYLFTTKNKLFLVKSFIIFFVLWIGAHAWWFLPFLSGVFTSNNVAAGLANSSGNIETLKAVSGFFPFLAVIRLMQYFYFKESWSFFYDNPFVIFISWLIPFIAYFSVDHLKKYKNIGVFIFLFLVSLFVVLGTNPPTGDLFLYIFKKIPYLQAYRNPYEKFGIVFLLAYTPFLAIGLTHVTKKVYKQIALLCLVCFILIFPLWDKSFCSYDTSKNNCWTRVPDYVEETNNYLNMKEGDFRVMMLPLGPHDGVSYKWPDGIYFGTDPTKFLIDRPAVSINAPGNREYYNVLLERFGDLTPNAFGVKDPNISNSEFRGENFFEELEKLNIQYIVVRKDLRHEAMGINTSPQDINNLLSAETGIDFIKTFGEYDIYKVNIDEEVSTLYSPDADIEYEKVSPTLYKFKITKNDYSKSTELRFLNTFNKDWKIRGEGFNVLSHEKLFSYANKYVIDHESKVEAELYYAPQEDAARAKNISLFVISLLVFYIFRWILINKN